MVHHWDRLQLSMKPKASFEPLLVGVYVDLTWLQSQKFLELGYL